MEVRHPVRFVGPGRVVAVDFFDRYDFIALWPLGGVACLVQVSTEGEGSHEEPLGFHARPEHPDALLMSPLSKYPISTMCPGVYEVYVYYRRLRRKGYVADRRWWSR